MKIGISAAVLAAGLSVPALAQTNMTGISHPDQLPITTSPAAATDPTVYLPYNPPGYVATVPTIPSETKPILTAAVAAAPMDDPKLSVHADPDANIVTRIAGPANQLPIGTTIKARIKEGLSTRTTVTGATFTAELIAPVIRDNRVLLPPGSILTGRVTEVHGGKRISGRASMHLMPQQVTLPDGTIYPFQAQVIDTDLFRSNKVDSEGTILHKGSKAGTVAAVGLSTGSGAAAGAIFGGWPGALIGAGVGAGVSTVVWLKQDRQTELPEGTGITFMLNRPILIDGK